MDILDRLLAHNAWTTNKLIEQSHDLTDTQLDQEFDIGLKTVRATIDHIIESIEWWTDLMNGAPQRTHENLGEDPMTLNGFAERLERVASQFAEVATRVQTEELLDETWQMREDFPETYNYGTTIIHVLTHSAHHRAQLMYMLKSLGVPDVIMAHALSW
jgi:uncharacterized damage-inducible protein DinB